MPEFQTVDTYIGNLQGPGRAMAENLRAIILRAVPEASEAIKYNMPAFQLLGRSFLFFGIWKKHAGVYPVRRGDPAFEAKVSRYRATKDAVHFRLAEPLPEELVAEIAQAQASRLFKI